ncbi:MAG: class C sortase [Clostridiales bacterium]|nr:class C sortase [Clostridiales bacterium]
MKKEKRPEGKKKGRLGVVALALILIAGMMVLLYPTVSNWWNKRVQSRAVADYDAAVADLSEAEYAACIAAAEAYNAEIAALGSAATIAAPELVDEDYWDLLDVTGTGIMGYVTIDKINVQLPIYHGTSQSVLSAGAGHLEGSSLPIGGESTHSVISAHRGLPSAMLFTNLDQLEVGDTFVITVLDQVYTYEVDKISIVLPSEVENLYIEEGEDYCTLMTCTPYGINSHRLLVRGVRIDNADANLLHVTAEAYQVDTIIVASAAAVPLLLVLFIWLIVKARRRKKEASQYE